MTDAVRACLYVVMAIFSAVRPRLMLWWHFSVLSLWHITDLLSMRYLYMLLTDFFGPSVLLFSWGIVIDDVRVTYLECLSLVSEVTSLVA